MHSVLIVEDEAAVARAMARWLDPSAHAVRHVPSAEDALEAMQCDAADVVICDVGLPGHDGVWLTGELRQRYPDTAVVLATGAADMSPTVSLRNGVVAYLLKPFGRDELRRAVREGLDWHEAAVRRRTGCTVPTSTRATGASGSVVGSASGIRRATATSKSHSTS